MLITLMNQLRKNNKTFNKLRTFKIFKSNPFYFKKSKDHIFDLPNSLLEKTQEF